MGTWNKDFEDMTIGEMRILHKSYVEAMDNLTKSEEVK